MKANELMIGDFVRTIYSQKIVKVKEVKQSCIYTEGNGYEYNEIEPIPLTIEILERNGFKKDDTLEKMYYCNWSICNDCISYDKETKEIRIFYTLGRLVFVQPLSYVHLLQHALRLCGIEKEIIL